MKRIILAFIGISFLLLLPSKAGENNRTQWINDAVHELKNFRPAKDTRLAQYDSKLKVYSVASHTLIRIGDEWVYFIVRSLHDDKPEPGKILIGDVALAIDSKGNIYSNSGHVCGTANLSTKTDKGFASLEEFLSSELNDQEKNPAGGQPIQVKRRWEKYKEPQQVK